MRCWNAWGWVCIAWQETVSLIGRSELVVVDFKLILQRASWGTHTGRLVIRTAADAANAL